MLQFKIQLKNVSGPKVWRRVIVPAHFSFHKFHHVIQEAFGWYNSHLYEFSPNGLCSYPAISIPEYSEEEISDSNKVKLSEIFENKRQKFMYVYDFGDNWEHEIILEKITKDYGKFAECIDGKGACPPEDCGAFWGYADLKKIMKNPKHPEYSETKEWLGLSKNKTWDAKKFDLEKVARKVRRVK